MNTLDIILLIPLAYFAYKGFSKGFIITLAMLAGILVGLYAAIHFSEYAVGFLTSRLNTNTGNIRMISYLVTFVAVLVLVYLLGQFLTGVVKTTGLGFLNRIGGVILGVAKGLLIISAILVLYNTIDPKSSLIGKETKEQSVLYEPVAAIAPKVYPVLKQYTDKALDFIKGGAKKNGSLDEPLNN